MVKQERVLVIDGNWYIHRAFFVAGLRRDFRFLEKSIPRLFLSMVIKDALILQTPYIAVTFDAPNSFRYKIYPRYKANRNGITVKDMFLEKGMAITEDMPSIDPYTYLSHAKKALRYAGIFSVTVDEMEGDDLHGAIATVLGKKHRIYLSTHDKDMLSLVNENVRVYWPASGKKEHKILGVKDVIKYKGVPPNKMRDFLCLVGDSVDNIPGVRNVSDKTAIKILKEHGSIGACLKSKTKHGKLLRDNINRLHLARKLVELRLDCWFPQLRELRLKEIDENRLVNIVGSIPEGLNKLHTQSVMSNTKGLFR